MSEFRRANSDDTYFITMVVVGWIDIFTRRDYAVTVVDNLNFCVQNKGLEIYNYCVMPSHIHMICRSANGQPMSHFLRDFKSYTAKQIIQAIRENPQESRREWLLYLLRFFAKKSSQNKEFMFWQKTNHPTCLFTNRVIDQKIEYIHNNPLVAGIVNDPEAYMYSSLNPEGRVILSKW